MTWKAPCFFVGALWCACAGGPEQREEAGVDPRAICSLIEGDVAGWAGLGELDHSQLPSCLGRVVQKGSRRMALATLASDSYRPRSARGEVRVDWFMNGGRVALVEVALEPALPAAPLLARLGDPETRFRYADEPELGPGELTPPAGGSFEELVYGARGLAVLLARDAAGVTTAVRLRGFDSVPSERYLDDYVRLRPEPL